MEVGLSIKMNSMTPQEHAVSGRLNAADLTEKGRKKEFHPLVSYLLEKGLISRERAELAKEVAEREKRPVTEVLSELKLLSGEDLASALADVARCEVVDLRKEDIKLDILHGVPIQVFKEIKCIPFRLIGGVLHVAFADPFDVVAIDRLRQISGKEVKVYVAPESQILEALDQLERSWKVEAPDTEKDAVDIVDYILSEAIRLRASDIHFEPQANYVRVRIRIDGVLRNFKLLPKGLQGQVISRLKVISNMDVAESRLPQDGRAAFQVGPKRVNLRFSSLPSAYGENIVVRVLDPAVQIKSIANLGLFPEDEKALRAMISRPHGVVIITGPTGSGKTTTLYAIINELNSVDRSIFTLEDPIEYQIEGVCQTQVNEEIGLTFDVGLRTLLRQDPDVILVGETRDLETARLMVRAALTGHLVLTTLHTNSAYGAIPRLIDMGVERFLLPAALVGVIAQRLVRRICPECRISVPNVDEYFEKSGLSKYIKEADKPSKAYKHSIAGCPKCDEIGYLGRHAVFELFVVTEDFRELIIKNASEAEFRSCAVSQGHHTLLENAVRLVGEGITDIEEVLRVIGTGD